ncbi:hypothetical protein E3T55_15835, partial [Cryobacterium frigoriphilum]
PLYRPRARRPRARRPRARRPRVRRPRVRRPRARRPRARRKRPIPTVRRTASRRCSRPSPRQAPLRHWPEACRSRPAHDPHDPPVGNGSAANRRERRNRTAEPGAV